MNSVFKCKPHYQQAIYINIKPDDKEPILLCQRCILAKNYSAKLLEEFLLQAQPILGQYLSQDVLDFSLNKKQFEDQLEKLKNTLIDTLINRITYFTQKLRIQFQEQSQILQYIKNQILHYQKCSQNQTFLLDDQIEDQLREYLQNQKSNNPKQNQIDYLYTQLRKMRSDQPFLNVGQIQEDFHELLDQFSQKVIISSPIVQPNYQINIFSLEDVQNIDINDFNISKTLVTNNYYPELNTLVDGIECVKLILNSSIDLFGFGRYQQLKELSILFNNCNIGLSKQIIIPNLKKLSLDFKGNNLREFEQIIIPETVIDFKLNLAQNLLDENCIYYIGQSIDNLRLQNLSISFNGFSLVRNTIWNTGLIQLCRVLFPQQLKQLHLGFGNCSINNVGVEFGIVRLLSKQRILDKLQLDLYSNQITSLNELSKVKNIIFRQFNLLKKQKLMLTKIRQQIMNNLIQTFLLQRIVNIILNKLMNYNEYNKLPSLTNSEQSIQNHFKQFSQPVRETWYQKDSSQEYQTQNQIDLNELPKFEMSSPSKYTNQTQFDHEFAPLECSFKQEKFSFQKWKTQEVQQENEKPKIIEYEYKQSNQKQNVNNFKQTLPQQLFQEESSQYFQMIEEPKQRQNFLYLNQQQISPQKLRQQPQMKQVSKNNTNYSKSPNHNKIDSSTPTKHKNSQNNSKYIILETNVPVNKKKFICQHPAPNYIVLDFTNKENPICQSHSTMQVQLSLKDLVHRN